MKVKPSSIHQRVWLLGMWGSGPLIVAIALSLFALHNGWIFGVILGLGWLVNILIPTGFIFWAINRGGSNESSGETV